MGFPAGQTAVFVGRERELGELRAAFDDAVNGNGRLAMVVGEPGIGKTALCKELARYVEEQGGTTLIGHCYEEGSLSLPYLPFLQAMRTYMVSRSEDDLRADLGDSASHVTRIMPEVQDKLGVEPGAPIDPEEDRYRLLDGVTTFLTNASKSRPLSIVLEDLHDADSGTLEMLTYLSGFLSETNALVVGTYRDVEVDRAHPLASALVELRRVSTFARVTLRGLGLEDVRRMITDVSGESITEHLAETVHRQTEGNPLFVQEVARYLREEQLLTTSDSEVDLRVPEGVRDVIGKRLSRLSKECNQMLAVASVIGREFDLDVLLEVSSMSEDDLHTHLEEAQGASVVEESSGLRRGLGYRFSHAMVRETLHQEIFAPLRIRLHQQVGRALEEVHSARLEEHAAELTDHFAQSTEREDLEKALSYDEMAAERAMSVYAYGEAVRLLKQALQVQEVLDPDDKAKQCDLLLALGEALMPAGDSLSVYEDVLPDAFGLAESLNDSERASRVCQLAVEAAQRSSRGELAQEAEFLTWAERADRFAVPGTRHRALADLAMSMVRLTTGDPGKAWTLRQRALDLARRLSDDEAFLKIAGMIISIDWAPQHQKERLDLAREVVYKYLDAANNLGQIQWLGSHQLGALADAFLVMGERARADELLSALKETAERTQDANALIGVLGIEAQVALFDGRLEEVVAIGDRIAVRGEELGLSYTGQLNRQYSIAAPLRYLGRTEQLLAEGLEFAQVFERRGAWDQLHANFLAHAGKDEQARDLSQRYMAEGRYGEQDDETQTLKLAWMLDTAVRVGDRETVEVLYGRLAPLTDQALVAGVNFNRTLGGAAALLRDIQGARAHYETGLAKMAEVHHRPEIALTRLELAELLLDHYPDERAGTLEHLDFAIGELRDMKMQPALDRALARLERQKDKKPPGPAYPDGLSEREVEVLRLIIAGASNQDIADALFITTNTVANHVKNILTKSNTDNRTAAAAYGIRHGLAED